MKQSDHLRADSKLKAILSIIGVSLAISSCCEEVTGSTSGGPGPIAVPAAITIDNSSVVPILGNTPTTSVIYVHNNSNTQISGITYTIDNDTVYDNSNSLQKNRLNSTNQRLFISKSSTNTCSSIPANQSCPLMFTTPSLTKQEAQGSAVITANYVDPAGINKNFAQIVSYSQVDNLPGKGAVLSGGVEIFGYGNENGYGMQYIYGSGINKLYTVTSITSNNQGVKVVQGDITGEQIQSNYVQPVEVMVTTIGQSPYKATLTVQSFDSSTLNPYTSQSEINIIPATGAILASGSIPFIDTSVESSSGRMLVVNQGNESAIISNIQYPTNITELRNPDSCSTIVPLESQASCTIYFDVAESTSGSDNIVVTYNNGTLLQNVTWFNGTDSPLLQMQAEPNPMVFVTGIGDVSTVTITNVGSFDLTNISIPAPVTIVGNATATVTESASCANGLAVNASCTYTVFVNNTAPEYGFIQLGVSGTYIQNMVENTYSRTLPLAYQSIFSSPILRISAISPLVITGNNTESSTKTLVITNIGSESTTSIIGQLTESNAMTLTDNCSGYNLGPNESCTASIKLGPTTAQTSESGHAVYTVIYTGNGIVGSESKSRNVPYIIQANNQGISINSVTATGFESGNGESAGTQYIFSGAHTVAKTITLTLINSGSNSITIHSITDNNSPITWQMSTSSTCMNGTILLESATCDIIFDNVLKQNILAESVGSSYQQNVVVPTVVFSDNVATGTQFSMAPPLPAEFIDDIIYAVGHQATIANSVVIESSGTPNMGVKITQILANAQGYGPITVKSQFENYFNGLPIMENCTKMDITGVIIQSCNLTPDISGAAISSGRYLVNQNLLPESAPALMLHSLFSIELVNDQTVSMFPLYILTSLPLRQ